MKRKRIALALIVATSLLALVFALQAMALGLLEPTTTWNVTPQEKTFKVDTVCPIGSTLVSDQFQSVTEGDPGVFTETYMVDGEMVTVQITTYADNSFDFNVVNGQMHRLFVKGGTGSGYLLYQYEPPVAGATNTGPVTYDTGLHDGYNEGGMTYQNVSHLDFCLEGGGGTMAPLTVTKTATPSYTRTYKWTIDKSVDKTEVLTSGDATFNYKVKVTRDAGTDSAWAVSGTISVYNPNTTAVSGVVITDTLGGSWTRDIPAGGTVDIPYTVALGGANSGTNTALATWYAGMTKHEDYSDPAAYTFGAPTKVVDDQVTVVDTNGKSWGPVSADTEWTYSMTFSDPAGTCTEHKNTATFTTDDTGTTGSDDVTVKVCKGADLKVTKTATPSYTRTYKWTIDKSVDKTYVEMPFDEGPAVFNYTVKVTRDAGTDSAWVVKGTITITNPNGFQDIVANVSDLLPGATVVLDPAGPVTVPKGGTKTVDYTATFASKPAYAPTELTNTATATWDAVAYGTPNGSASGTKTFSFGAPTAEVDECVDVSDTYAGFLGKVCEASKTFTYARSIAVLEGCYEYDNTATFKTNDTGATGSDSVTVTVCGPVFMDETAWAANGGIALQLPYNSGKKRGSWATYVAYYDVLKTTTLFAAKTIPVGTVTFSACSGGTVKIDIVLTGDWEFAYEDGVVRVQDYATAPSGNPSPGQFAYKADATSPTEATITVPCNNFYGVHADVGQWILPD